MMRYSETRDDATRTYERERAVLHDSIRRMRAARLRAVKSAAAERRARCAERGKRDYARVARCHRHAILSF